uniref:Acriflavin resistance protein n=1 Tax=uncultured Planctomycetota bacterium TaxID=120965 RepID=H5SAT8_9BACT|nr:acriflavin resistance protein [uncultured Planctomycetota bacterium]
MAEKSFFVLRHRKAILFISAALCAAGIYCAYRMPSAVFPQTDFPRVVILIDNGVMPADEMMAMITRPVEEAMKNIPGTVNIRSTTGRGSADISVFFDWSTDMERAELYVLGRLAQIRSQLPPSAEFSVHRLTFSAFPILGVSLTSSKLNVMQVWEIARYELSPRLLRIPGVAQVKIVGGRQPEYHVLVDTVKLEALHLTLKEVVDALANTNELIPSGMHEENRQLYLTVLDNRVRRPKDLGEVVLAWRDGSPVYLREVADVRLGEAPQFNVVTADGRPAVLMNIYSQPNNASTTRIAAALHDELNRIRRDYPPDMRLAIFYDQSVFVKEGERSVWEAIVFGLALSAIVLLLFLRNIWTTIVAVAVIPATVLITIIGLRACGMSFNLMTLGGIAAAVGIIIDDAIVVAEAIYAKLMAGYEPANAVTAAVLEVGRPLVGSTFTPVVVFFPLTYLEGVAGVFFRALALTMVFALLTSLVLAVTFTPALASLVLRRGSGQVQNELEQGGPVLRACVSLYERVALFALRWYILALFIICALPLGAVWLYGRLETGFLPEMDEGAFVLDYFTRPGTSLQETDRILKHVEQILLETPEVESFSRRTGARLALAIAEPNTGDFLVKLRSDRKRSTAEVIADLRQKIHLAEPALHTEFPGVLSDLIGDLTWSPDPCEIKIFSTDIQVLKSQATAIAKAIETIPGVVDVNDGLVVAGPVLRFIARPEQTARLGLSPADVGNLLRTALLGTEASFVLQGDRVIPVRVLIPPRERDSETRIRQIPVRVDSNRTTTLEDLVDVQYEPGMLEMHREDLRQLVAVTARFEGLDLGTGMRRIQQRLRDEVHLPPGAWLEFGGLYEQQQRSFRNLTLVLLAAAFLVFTVLLVEFHAFLQPLAIVGGSLLALFGVLVALYLTGITLNIVSFLGAIIGMGIVAKNGILMMDYVGHLQAAGLPLREALVQSGRRRLRPVLMTSVTTLLGLLPLAYGIGAGADMLRPLAVAVIGALVFSLLLSLVATPVLYDVLVRCLGLERHSQKN